MKRLGLLLMAVLLVGACSREPMNLQGRIGRAYTRPLTVADWIIQGRNDFLLVDLRSKSAFDEAHIPGAMHLGEGQSVGDPQVVKSLPDYKTLVFYGANGDFDPKTLYPAFERGLHVMILDGGYSAWEQAVLTPPEEVASNSDAKREAISKYFRGESALGTPKALDEISADKYIRQPTLPVQKKEAAPFQMEGC